MSGHTEDLKNGTCGLSSLVLSIDGRVQGNSSLAVLRLATSAAFTVKVATWPTVQVSGDGRCRPLLTSGHPRKECEKIIQRN